MELNGALLNRDQLANASLLVRSLAARPEPRIQSQSQIRPRAGAVQEAVIRAPAQADRPLRAREIHQTAQELVGTPLSFVLGCEFVAEATVLFHLGTAVVFDSRGSRSAVGALVDGHQVDHFSLFPSLVGFAPQADTTAVDARHQVGQRLPTRGRSKADLREFGALSSRTTGGRFRLAS